MPRTTVSPEPVPMSGAAPRRAPVEVRRGQLWEFGAEGGPARRARVVRLTMAIFGTRYVFLKRLADGRSMRVPLRRLQLEEQGARLVEDAPAQDVERKSRSTAGVEPPPRSATVHEPRMSVSDRRHAVARARVLRASGRTVRQIADVLCVMPEVIEVWLAEEPSDGT